MWTRAHREIHRQSGVGLPSDLTDGQWARLEPLIPAAKPGGRPRETDMQAAMNAIFYLLRTGCPWRYLPRGDFPRARRSTTYSGSSRAAESRGTTGTTIVCWHRRRLRGPECLNGVQIAIVHGAVHPSQEARCRPASTGETAAIDGARRSGRCRGSAEL